MIIDKLGKLDRLENLIEDVFNCDDFCERCVANGQCNGNCCYEQLKEIFNGEGTEFFENSQE